MGAVRGAEDVAAASAVVAAVEEGEDCGAGGRGADCGGGVGLERADGQYW